MANTTNTKSTTTTKTTKQTEAPVVDAEKEALKAQLAEQQKRMEEMMAQMQVLMQAQSQVKTDVASVEDKSKALRNIKFVNMCPGNINLRGTRMHRIEGQYKYKMIPESEAFSVVNNMPETVSSGMVYIDDPEFVHKCDLDEIYRHILSATKLKELLKQNVVDICEVYKGATDQQKQIIVDTISNMVLDGHPVDANVLVKIGELSGKNLIDIEPLDDKE